MINPQHLRPGNWIYPTGRSQYRVVTGGLLAMMEKMPEFCNEFEGIELTGELLKSLNWKTRQINGRFTEYFIECTPPGYKASAKHKLSFRNMEPFLGMVWMPLDSSGAIHEFPCKYLHQLQNLFFWMTGSELPLPESAKIIPQSRKSKSHFTETRKK